MSNTYLVYRGVSRLEDAPIGAFSTIGSRNVKTGNVISIMFLRLDIDPLSAIRLGADSAICGDCQFMGVGGIDRGCYVNVLYAPSQIWKAWKAGNVPDADPDFVAYNNRLLMIRFGSYGDPTSIQSDVLRSMKCQGGKSVGYTQFWEKPDNQSYRDILMASCKSAEEADRANALGWRAFIVPIRGERIEGAITCPASVFVKDENGKKIPAYRNRHGKPAQCDTCGLCDGVRNKPNVTAAFHGSFPRHHARKSMAAKMAPENS